MSFALIAALDRNRAIGKGNAMPWHLSADLKRFKQLTLGKQVLMGHNTARAIGMALPGRNNLVMSRSHAAPFPRQHTVRSLDEARLQCGNEDMMVIGGGEIYRLTMPLAQKLYLTFVDAQIAGADTWFPEFDPTDWRELSRQHHPADDKHAYAFDWVDYARAP